MKIEYDEREDILFIRFSDDPVIRDVSHGWNVTVGLTEHGVGQITVLDAKSAGLFPLRVSEKLLKLAS